MTLINARLPYRTIRDGILTLLRNNKSTLNYNLTLGNFSQDVQIKPGDPLTLEIKSVIYPTILLKVSRKEEAFLTNTGAAARKRVDIVFMIYALVRVPNLSTESDNDIMQLASNIEAILRDNVDINNNCLYSEPTVTDFGVSAITEQNLYIDICGIELHTISEVK